jgi:hypothetical protein
MKQEAAMSTPTEPTIEQIAADYELWQEYVDPNDTMSREEFDELSYDDRVEFMRDIWGYWAKAGLLPRGQS